jgi:hypothetical protein
MSEKELQPITRNMKEEQVMSQFVIYMSRLTREDLVGTTVKELTEKFFEDEKATIGGVGCFKENEEVNSDMDK